MLIVPSKRVGVDAIDSSDHIDRNNQIVGVEHRLSRVNQQSWAA
jgi:hypothetical protein